MSQEYLKEYNEKMVETPDKYEGAEADHCASITNFYKQLHTSDIDLDESTPFKHSNLKYVFGFVGLLGAMHFWSKRLMDFEHVNPYTILFVRSLVSTIFSAVHLRIQGVSIMHIEPGKAGLVVIGAVVGFLELCGLYNSLFTLSLTDAFALDSLSVLVTTFLDYVMFQGTLKFSHFLGYICAFVGILFLVRPTYLFSDTEDDDEKANFVYGFIFGLAGAFFNGVYSGFIRRTFMKVNVVLSFTYRQVVTMLLSPLAVLIFNKVSTLSRDAHYTSGIMLEMCCIGVLGWASGVCLNLALQEEKLISRIYPFKFVLIVFGIIMDLTYFNSDLVSSTYIGLGLIGANFLLSIYYLFYVSA